MSRKQTKPAAPVEFMFPSERRRVESFQGFKTAYSTRLGNAERKAAELEARVAKLEADAAALLQIACSAQEVAFTLQRQALGQRPDESIYDMLRAKIKSNQQDD